MAQIRGYGFVKEVLTGDTLVIIGQPKGSPPPELKLTLASLQAPRLALKPTTMSSDHLTTNDQEAFAWESREFLRKLCIGKQVYFKVEYTVESIGRHFGAVYLIEQSESDLFVGPSKHKMSENICLTVAREGWCGVRSRSNDNELERSGDFEEMSKLSRQAEEGKKGKFNVNAAKASIRTVTWDFKSSKESSGESGVLKFFNKIKNKPQRALVEYIRDGSSLKALLLESMTLVTFNLAGVQCPRINSKAVDSATDPQEYAQEAKFFTEVRLLNREVILNVGGINEKYSTFFGALSSPRNSLNLAIELVRNGLAHPADWSMSFISSSMAASIHQSVQVAKKSKLRLWKNYSPPVIPGNKAYVGYVSEILSGDSFMVRIGKEEDLTFQPWLCQENRINLSSIRAPRMRRKEGDEAYARESREFLRTRLIGRKVSVTVEYVVGNEDEKSLRKYGTVFLLSGSNDPQNVSVSLLENGLATLMVHRQGAARSEFYHELIEAETKAKENEINMWSSSTEKAERTKVVEVNSAALAKAHLSNLKNDRYEKKITAVVEYIFNGARMKLHIPSHDINIVFNLSGIQCARTGKQKVESAVDMFGEQALAFSRAMVLHKNVEIIVESVDKGGNFIGTMYAKPIVDASRKLAPGRRIGSRENLAVLLLRFGLARTNSIGIRFAKFAEFLINEENDAKEGKAGLWLNYVEEVPVEQKEEEEVKIVQSNSKKMSKIVVSVCHINNANNFFVHIEKENSQRDQIEKAMTELTTEIGTEPSTGEESYKKGEQVIALYDDGSSPKWYRASVTSIQREGDVTYTIKYLDYGNTETVSSHRLKKATNEELKKLTPTAHQTSLAFMRAPTLSQEYGREAAMYLSQLTRGKKLQAYLHSKEKGGSLVLSLIPAGKSQEEEESEEILTINGLLLKEGLATIPRKVVPYLRGSVGEHEKKLLNYLNEQQDEAHAGHVNLWTYGDPREDEE